jgi:Fe-S-cluster containining protein
MVKMDGHCIFLLGNRCTIYDNRPLICRFYPFTMSEVDDYLFDADRGCEGVGKGSIIDERYFKKLVYEARRTIGKTVF